MTPPTFSPIAVCELDIADADSFAPLRVADRYERARVLLRWRAHPLALVDAPVRNGVVDLAPIQAALEPEGTAGPLLIDVLCQEQFEQGPASYHGEGLDRVLERSRLTGAVAALEVRFGDPSLTVAVCTRKRPDDLRAALATAVRTVGVERVLVVDNDPGGSARAVAAEFEGVDYVAEFRPGLDFARNRAIAECQTDLLGFCDDDARLDPYWAVRVRRAFGDDPAAGAVTGLVLAAQLDHEAQELFERTGGFRRGFEPKRGMAQLTSRGWRSGQMLGIGDYGVGTNMTFRTRVFDEVGLFDEALDSGTIVGGAGDLDMLYRVAMGGHAIRYTPSAIVWHRHRNTKRGLARQLSYNGGVVAFLQGVMERFPLERPAVRWVAGWVLRHLIWNIVTGPIPRRYAIAEAYGYVRCLVGRHRARSMAAAQRHGLTTTARTSSNQPFV